MAKTQTVEDGPIKRSCLLVLGMHRSGTSALTRVLNLFGATLPQVLLGSGPGNDTGHWEPSRVVALLDQLLVEAGSSWDDWRELDISTLAARVAHYKAELAKLIADDFGEERLFVLKDPRVCRMVPFFADVLADLDIELKPVIIFRHPGEVAKSLQARNGFSEATSELIWLRHLIAAERDTRIFDRAIISYDGLMSDWRSVLRKISSSLFLSFDLDSSTIQKEVDVFLSPNLRHNTATLQNFSEHELRDSSAALAFSAISRLSNGEADASTILDRIDEELSRSGEIFNRALCSEREAWAGSVVAYEQAKAAFANEALGRQELESRLRDAQANICTFENRSATLEQEVRQLKDLNDAAREGLEQTRVDLHTTLEKVRSIEDEAHEVAARMKKYPDRKRRADLHPPDDRLAEALQHTLMIIPSINGAALLERMLPTLNIPPKLVVVLDQNSTDATESICGAAGVEFMQLGRPYTYTEACNFGFKLARERGCEFLVIANNDISFKTDVVRELLSAMLSDGNLAIAAPSQILVDEKSGVRLLVNRVFWDLQNMRFEHDFAPPNGSPLRLEADFCELTLAMVRVDLAEKVGQLDDEFGFYFEDADFGFRLRIAGYACAYLPQSQIEHFSSSTVNRSAPEWKLQKLNTNRKLFARKFRGYGLRHADHRSGEATSWNVVNINLHRYILKYGLLDESKPELIFSHPGTQPFEFLFTVWETTKLPQAWHKFHSSYKLVMAPSNWNVELLRDNGYSNVHYVPLGVETDVFHPWGEEKRFHQGLTFFWFSTNQHRKGLDVMLACWCKFFASHPGARLILMGRDISVAGASTDLETSDFHIKRHEDLGIFVYSPKKAIPTESLAIFYRSVDFVVCTSRSEGFGFVVVEALACGTPAIFGDFGATAEFNFPGALTFAGALAKADYTDKGFDDVGNWFEPDIPSVVECLERAAEMSDCEYSALSHAGMTMVRNKFTWHQTAIAVWKAVATVQPRTLAALATPSTNYTRVKLPTSIQVNTLPPPRFRRSRRLAIIATRRTGQALTNFSNIVEAQGGFAGARYLSQAAGRFVRRRTDAVKIHVRGWPASTILNKQAKGSPISADRPLRNGALFIGYVEASLGLAEVLRGMLRAVARHSSDFAIYPFNVGVETRRIGAFMPESYETSTPYKTNIIYVAADQVPTVFANLPAKIHERSYNILRTYWELPRAPEDWRQMLKGIDEIWAPNDFVRRAFAGIFSGPINIIPPCVDVQTENGVALPGRESFTLDSDRFYFLFSFDFYSSPFRKNPLAVIEAFELAFKDKSDRVGLVIKSIGAPDHHPQIKAKFAEAVARDPRIKIIDKTLSRSEMLGLIKACDCYVSLHRAEGFGAGMVEAMGMEKPVIGTAFSGSEDFLHETIAYPVPYKLRPVLAGEYVWSENQVWAEPDVSGAARIFRSVWSDPITRAEKTRAAKNFVHDTYGPDAVAQAVLTRLSELNTKA